MLFDALEMTRRWQRSAALLIAAAMAATMMIAMPITAHGATPLGPLPGLKGEYFKIHTSSYDFIGEPVSTVRDGALDYDDMVPIYQRRVGQGEWTGSDGPGISQHPRRERTRSRSSETTAFGYG